MTRFFSLPAFCMFAIFLIPSATFAETSPDRFQMNHDIHIQADEKVGDVTCIGCSVYVRGQVSGDVTAIAGGVIAESGASIATRGVSNVALTTFTWSPRTESKPIAARASPSICASSAESRGAWGPPSAKQNHVGRTG